VKRFSSALMVLLAVVALLWGNCLSCPQMIMGGQGGSHSCCHKPQPAQAKCHTQDMQHFVNAQTHAPVAPVVLGLSTTPEVELALSEVIAPAVILHAPPGNPILITHLRV
jgi:hypothetical protein